MWARRLLLTRSVLRMVPAVLVAGRAYMTGVAGRAARVIIAVVAVPVVGRAHMTGAAGRAIGAIIAVVVVPVAGLVRMMDVAGRAGGLAMTIAVRSMAAVGCGDAGIAMTARVRACGRCRIGGVIAAFMHRRPDITGSSMGTSSC